MCNKTVEILNRCKSWWSLLDPPEPGCRGKRTGSRVWTLWRLQADTALSYKWFISYQFCFTLPVCTCFFFLYASIPADVIDFSFYKEENQGYFLTCCHGEWCYFCVSLMKTFSWWLQPWLSWLTYLLSPVLILDQRDFRFWLWVCGFLFFLCLLSFIKIPSQIEDGTSSFSWTESRVQL